MLPMSEACERNKEPILAVLRSSFAECLEVLEIGSGTGQHAVYFARHLTHLTWRPTEQLSYLPDLTARAQLEGSPNLKPPTVLDVRQSVWPVHSVDGVFMANTLHIMSWPEVVAAYRGIGKSSRRAACCAYTARSVMPASTHRTAIEPSTACFRSATRAQDCGTWMQ
jgi:hypothetical protein